MELLLTWGVKGAGELGHQQKSRNLQRRVKAKHFGRAKIVARVVLPEGSLPEGLRGLRGAMGATASARDTECLCVPSPTSPDVTGTKMPTTSTTAHPRRPGPGTESRDDRDDSAELYYASSPLSVLGTDFRILGDSHLRNCGGFLRWATLECAKPRLGPSRPLLNSNLSPKQPLPQRLSERPSSEREARSTAAGPAPSPRSRPRGPRSPRGPRGGRGSRGRGRGSDGGR